MAKQILLALTVMALSACANVVPEPTGPWTEWVCDSDVKVFWRPDNAAEQGMEVRVGAGDMIHHLRREPSGSGVLYSDNQLAFHVKGNEGLLYWLAGNDLIGRGCKAQPN